MKKACLIIVGLIFIITSVFAADYTSVYTKANSKFEQKDYKGAMDLFKQAFTQGDSINSPLRIGEMYLSGFGTEADEQQGINWIAIAAGHNNAIAQDIMGHYYHHLDDYESAIYWFSKAANNGDNDGKANLAMAYLYGKGGLVKNPQKALRWMLAAAQGNHPAAQWEIAKAYFDGHKGDFDIDCDSNQFVYWTRRAAENGVAEAQCYLGRIYLEGFNNTPIDKKLAKEWLQRASAQGWEEANTILKENFQ